MTDGEAVPTRAEELLVACGRPLPADTETLVAVDTTAVALLEEGSTTPHHVDV